MSEILTNWLMLIAIFGVAVISPGPDFVVAVRNSILYSRRVGLWTALGFGCGVIFHVTYTIFGIAALIAQSIVLFNLLKYAGAAYLFYVGFKAIRSKGMSAEAQDDATNPASPKTMTDMQAFRSGFITNLLNPKATMFFLALFSQILQPDFSMLVQIGYGATCVIMVTVWFSLVATVLTTPAIKARFMKMTKWIDRTCGALFIALGVKLAFTKAV